jgi:hypothetical protein
MSGMHLNGARRPKAKKLLKKCMRAFWKRAEEIVLFSAPFVKVLRMVDGDKPTTGFGDKEFFSNPLKG